MRYFLELSYNGSGFHGWQSQPNAVSVQSTIEKALSTIFRNNISITGAGRTDTGVHAFQMYAHFDLPFHIEEEKKFILSLNSLVGKDIFIKKMIKVEGNSHARFDASERSYKYFVTFEKNPFLKDLCWFSPSNLDFDKMNEAARLLLNTNDFTSFAKLHSDAKTNICDVREAIWKSVKEDCAALNFLGSINNGYVFTITADRFLRNMVRAVVGTLIEVGRNKISLQQFNDIIGMKNRCSAGTSMPAHALYLWHISYPFIP